MNFPLHFPLTMLQSKSSGQLPPLQGTHRVSTDGWLQLSVKKKCYKKSKTSTTTAAAATTTEMNACRTS